MEEPDPHKALASREPAFARLIATYGPQDPFVWHDGGRTGKSLFAALLLHITGQRISALAGFTLFDRIAAAADGIPTPEVVQGLGVSRLRSMGLSNTKAECAVALAGAQTHGTLDLDALAGVDDRAVVDTLTSVRGIGQWTAQAFLMRQLHRPDVLPADDMGLRQAVQHQWRLGHLPTVGEVRTRGAAWSPYRSYASALLWRSLKPVGELSDPKERALYHLGGPTGTRPS
ncbi:DNA-3-methyladenine glycosylase family protein [Streptomyces sp. NPDC087843]|uniref:DNA-3-methyladenine glycosylase family protein n=1 Tax=Streptomyces sp. NPDC087843 TaxID=3365804 RepID=UPI00382F748D